MQSFPNIISSEPASELFHPDNFDNFVFYRHFLFYFLSIMTLILILTIIYGFIKDSRDEKLLQQEEKEKIEKNKNYIENP